MAAKKRKAAKREKAGKQPVTQDGRTANSPERRAARERALEIAARDPKRREHDAKLAKMLPGQPGNALSLILISMAGTCEKDKPGWADFSRLVYERTRAWELVKLAVLPEDVKGRVARAVAQIGAETTKMLSEWHATDNEQQRQNILTAGFTACRRLRDVLMDLGAETYEPSTGTRGGAATKPSGLDEADSTWSAKQLAEKHGLSYSALRARLDRARQRDHACFCEVNNPLPNEPKYLYYARKVAPIIKAMKADARKRAPIAHR